MHSTSTFLLVIFVALCTNLPSRVEPKTTAKSLPTARHGGINNLTPSVMNGTINSSNVIHGNNNNRIVGGHIASAHQFAFMVSIYKLYAFHCGGTLVRADWVLTARHCLFAKEHEPKLLPTYFAAFAGHTDLNKVKFHDLGPENPEMRDVNETYPYEHYVSLFEGGDIGLMHLVSKFELGENIQLVPLDPQGISKDHYEEQWIPCTVPGWGNIEFVTGAKGDITRNYLHYIDVDMISTYRCDNRYQELLNEQISNKVHICAQGRLGGPCFGDSGGPLLCGFYQVGVDSFGKDCARNPEVFTRIANYRNWINETIDPQDFKPNPHENSASSTRIRPGAYVVVAIIVMVINFNVIF